MEPSYVGHAAELCRLAGNAVGLCRLVGHAAGRLCRLACGAAGLLYRLSACGVCVFMTSYALFTSNMPHASCSSVESSYVLLERS